MTSTDTLAAPGSRRTVYLAVGCAVLTVLISLSFYFYGQDMKTVAFVTGCGCTLALAGVLANAPQGVASLFGLVGCAGLLWGVVDEPLSHDHDHEAADGRWLGGTLVGIVSAALLSLSITYFRAEYGDAASRRVSSVRDSFADTGRRLQQARRSWTEPIE